MSSLDEARDRGHSPEGDDSYCFFNRALANQEKPLLHKKALGQPGPSPHSRPDPFPRQGCAVDLHETEEKLLQLCVKGQTQNAAESLNNKV